MKFFFTPDPGSRNVRNSRGTDSSGPRLKSWDPSLERREHVLPFRDSRTCEWSPSTRGWKSLQVSRGPRSISSRVEKTVGKNANNRSIFPECSRIFLFLFRIGTKRRKLDRISRVKGGRFSINYFIFCLCFFSKAKTFLLIYYEIAKR